MHLIVTLAFLVSFIAVEIATSETYEDYDIVRVNVNFSEVYTFDINNTKEYVLVYPESNLIFPHRVSVWSLDATQNFPAMVVLRQEKSILSWQVPIQVDTQFGPIYYSNTSRTLCLDNMDVVNTMDKGMMKNARVNNLITQSLRVSLSTADVNPTKVSVIAEEEYEFYIEKERNYSLTVSPSQPRYVYYKFSEDDSDTMLIYLNSMDDVCLTISIQDSICPVMDLNKDITYRGKYATIDKRGGITIMKEDFPNGFFLVFVANGDNFDCTQGASAIPNPILRHHKIRQQNRTSLVTFTIKDRVNKEDYVKAALISLAAVAVFAIVSIVTTCAFFRWGRLASLLNNRDEADGDDERYRLRSSDIEKFLCNEQLMVRQLCTKPNRNKRKSYNYLWHVNSIAIFYSIPVVQLVITYQRVVNLSGDLDLCYYNFLCAHPGAGLSDFNHVLSNVGYVLIGVLYIGIVLYRSNTIRPLKDHGIPVHYGFFYAMGVALIIEGLLSACYHICPSQSSYQFDLSFMYIMAILIMVKLYHNRHPDVNASAYATFAVIGIGIFAAMIGILNGSLTIWILFIIIYVWFCIYLSLKIYFLSYVLQGVKKFKDDFHKYGLSKESIAPIKKARFILLFIANIFNYTIIVLGVLYYIMGNIDFGTFLLAMLLGNSVLHSTFYIAMKLLHKEKLCSEAILFGILALCFWLPSGYFFFDYSTQWTLTPAQSREHNQFCMLMDFFDSHDVWHMLSAGAMFLTFMFLLTLDDDLAMTPQDSIPVF